MAEAEVDEYEDPYEAVRIAIIVAGIAANLAIVYWQIKDTPDMIAARARLKAWLDRHFAAPARARKALARAEAETVFEAMQVVDGGAA